jgi:hypothetical protein
LSGSTQPNISLVTAANVFMEQALSPSTISAYSTAWRAFKSFISLSNRPYACPHAPLVDETTLVMFASYCATSLKLSYHSIKQYLSGVRYFCIKITGVNPLTAGTGRLPPSLHLVMRGIRKSQGKPGALQRLPITTPILSRLCSLLAQGVFGTYWDTLLTAAFNLAFFAFLHCGEFTTRLKRFDMSTRLCFNDISVVHTDKKASQMSLLLRASKTDPFRQGCTITLYPTGNTLCPVETMLRYLALRAATVISVGEPLFLTPDRAPLTRGVFIEALRSLLQRLGLESAHYAGHSFRKGAATSAADAGIPDHLIKTMGRWSSDCYVRYISTPVSLLQSSQCRLANVSQCRLTK